MAFRSVNSNWLCAILVWTPWASPVNGAPAPAPATVPASTEYKAVLFQGDEKEATKKLNDLASAGWEYVGPLGNGLVAFKRKAATKEELEMRGEREIKQLIAAMKEIKEAEKDPQKVAAILPKLMAITKQLEALKLTEEEQKKLEAKYKPELEKLKP